MEDYHAMEIQPEKTFDLGKNWAEAQKTEYMSSLSEFADVFAWKSSDLIGIPTSLGEHQIDFVEGAKSRRQPQSRLNPKYSAMVEEGLDGLLEAWFIYPINNTEWVSPIVVVPKKVEKTENKNPSLPRFLQTEYGDQEGLLSTTFHTYGSWPRGGSKVF